MGTAHITESFDQRLSSLFVAEMESLDKAGIVHI